VAPVEPRGGRRGVTAPNDPTDVSREEFDAMVRDLGIEEERQPASTGARGRPAGGRRARANGGRSGSGPAPGSGGAPARPAPKPDGDEPKPEAKKPRNRKHGRPR
jgi:SecD/SecF fusion protein